MTTLSPTKARANLTHWLKRAAAGEDVGILCGDQVIALRPVQVFSADSDYARREYGVTDAELDAFVRRLRRNFFECRAGVDVRLIFEVQPRTRLFHDAGNHDAVQRFIRNW